MADNTEQRQAINKIDLVGEIKEQKLKLQISHLKWMKQLKNQTGFGIN